MKGQTRTAGLLTAALFIAGQAAAFDWPQTEIESASFYSYFGQLRGGTISSSLVFTESADIKAADEGRVIAVISEHDESCDMFESTLGNAVIISHKDSLLTVYANLSSAEEDMRESLGQVATGSALGTCSNSGWQEGQGCLEFQVIDTQDRSFINPRVLMPHFGEELELSLHNITAVSKKGIEYTLGLQRNVSAGVYSFYKQRQDKASEKLLPFCRRRRKVTPALTTAWRFITSR